MISKRNSEDRWLNFGVTQFVIEHYNLAPIGSTNWFRGPFHMEPWLGSLCMMNNLTTFGNLSTHLDFVAHTSAYDRT